MPPIAFMISGLLVLAGPGALAAAPGFLNVAVGDTVADCELRGVDDRPEHLLDADHASILVFFKPGQEHSRSALRQLAELEKEFSSRPVRWVGVVSDRVPRTNTLDEVRISGVSMRVLIDIGDAVYGRLGVVQEPALGFVSREGRLDAFQAYSRVNFAEFVRARVRHVLGEVADEELEEALHPRPLTTGGSGAAAHARLRLAERLLASGRTNQALSGVRLGLAEDPSSVVGHLLLGRILLALGQRAEARKAFMEALRLEPGQPDAREGILSCGPAVNAP